MLVFWCDMKKYIYLLGSRPVFFIVVTDGMRYNVEIMPGTLVDWACTHATSQTE
jgi:hypothetical protein